MWWTSRSSIVNIEMNSLNAMILISSSFSAFVDSMLALSFLQTILMGKSPLAMVHVKVIRSPFWILDVRREKGAILGATICHNITIWNKSTIIMIMIIKMTKHDINICSRDINKSANNILMTVHPNKINHLWSGITKKIDKTDMLIFYFVLLSDWLYHLISNVVVKVLVLLLVSLTLYFGTPPRRM